MIIEYRKKYYKMISPIYGLSLTKEIVTTLEPVTILT